MDNVRLLATSSMRQQLHTARMAFTVNAFYFFNKS